MKSGHDNNHTPFKREDQQLLSYNLNSGRPLPSGGGSGVPPASVAFDFEGTMPAEENRDKENSGESPLAVPSQSQPFLSVGAHYSMPADSEPVPPSVPALSSLDELLGTIYIGKYELLSRLGAGGMGVIYLARQIFLDRLVAIKMLKNKTASAKARMRFHQEGKAASALNHPGIVAINDFGTDEEDRPYMVMEYVEGVTLSDIIRDRTRLRFDEALPVFLEILDALAVAHSRGVVHRDIKPSNIMLAMGIDGVVRVKLLDFGIAKLLDEDDHTIQNLTRTGEALGTPLYMSPEQIVSRKVDYRSDLYSFGCVMYVCLTGLPPFVGENKLSTMEMHVGSMPFSLSKMVPGLDLPAELDGIGLRLLAKAPESRYQSAEAVRMALLGVAVDGGMLPPAVLSAPRNVRERTVSQSLTMSEALSSMVPAPSNFDPTQALTNPAYGQAPGQRPGQIQVDSVGADQLEPPGGAGPSIATNSAATDELGGMAWGGTFDSLTAPGMTQGDALARTLIEPQSMSAPSDPQQGAPDLGGTEVDMRPGDEVLTAPTASASMSFAADSSAIGKAIADFSVLAGSEQDLSAAAPAPAAVSPAAPASPAPLDVAQYVKPLSDTDLSIPITPTKRPSSATTGSTFSADRQIRGQGAADNLGGRQTGNYLAAARNAAIEESLTGANRFGATELDRERAEDDADEAESAIGQTSRIVRRIGLPSVVILLAVALLATGTMIFFTIDNKKAVRKTDNVPSNAASEGVRINISDDDLILSSLIKDPNQTQLTLSGKELSAKCLQEIGKMPKLSELRLTQAHFSAGDLMYLKNSPVQYLYLAGTDTDDQSLAYISRMPQLLLLDLSHTRVGNEGMAFLARSRALQNLILTKTTVSDEGLVHLAKSPALSQTLQTLDLDYCYVTGAGIVALKSMPQLRALALKGTRFRPYVSSLAVLTHLATLDLSGNELQDRDLSVLASLPQMQQLLLRKNMLTAGCLPYLKQCKKLAQLSLVGVDLSENDKAKMKKALGNCIVYFDTDPFSPPDDGSGR
jgi:serine/threonine protein kinase